MNLYVFNLFGFKLQTYKVESFETDAIYYLFINFKKLGFLCLYNDLLALLAKKNKLLYKNNGIYINGWKSMAAMLS
jgi:hypothetical protein